MIELGIGLFIGLFWQPIVYYALTSIFILLLAGTLGLMWILGEIAKGWDSI